jgi:hypothetical protein
MNTCKSSPWVCFIFSTIFCLNAVAQDTILPFQKAKLVPSKTLTIVYTLSTESSKKTSIEETYNGGTLALFINNKTARIRFVSLMRIQSMFFNVAEGNEKSKVYIFKESGKEKYKSVLKWPDWQNFNQSYNAATYEFLEDSMVILKYNCKKVIITAANNRKVIAYYTKQFTNPIIAIAEPIFAGIPGVVLYYEYSEKKNKVKFTATDILTNPISKEVFKMPAKGYLTKKYTTNPANIVEIN